MTRTGFTIWLTCCVSFVGALAWFQTLSGIPWLAFDVTPLAVFWAWLAKQNLPLQDRS